MLEEECLMRIEAPHYVAGIIWRREVDLFPTFRTVSGTFYPYKAAPIVSWVLAKRYTMEWVESFCRAKGYKICKTFHQIKELRPPATLKP